MRKSSRRKSSVRRVARKAQPRKPEPRKAQPRKPQPKPERNGAMQIVATTVIEAVGIVSAPLRTHKYRVGQTVFYTSSPITRPGAAGSYQVVRLLPSDGEDYQYRIKNPGEAFERVAKESQLELEG